MLLRIFVYMKDNYCFCLYRPRMKGNLMSLSNYKACWILNTNYGKPSEKTHYNTEAINKFGLSHPQPSMCPSACCLVFFYQIVVLVNIYQIKQRIGVLHSFSIVFNNCHTRPCGKTCGLGQSEHYY